MLLFWRLLLILLIDKVKNTRGTLFCGDDVALLLSGDTFLDALTKGTMFVDTTELEAVVTER